MTILLNHYILFKSNSTTIWAQILNTTIVSTSKNKKSFVTKCSQMSPQQQITASHPKSYNKLLLTGQLGSVSNWSGVWVLFHVAKMHPVIFEHIF